MPVVENSLIFIQPTPTYLTYFIHKNKLKNKKKDKEIFVEEKCTFWGSTDQISSIFHSFFFFHEKYFQIFVSQYFVPKYIVNFTPTTAYVENFKVIHSHS